MRFDDAVDLQMQAIFEALKTGELAQRPDLRENLERYEAGQPAAFAFAIPSRWRSSMISRSNSALTARLWPVNTGSPSKVMAPACTSSSPSPVSISAG